MSQNKTQNFFCKFSVRVDPEKSYSEQSGVVLLRVL